jgi:hypothetical protein
MNFIDILYYFFYGGWANINGCSYTGQRTTKENRQTSNGIRNLNHSARVTLDKTKKKKEYRQTKDKVKVKVKVAPVLP